MKKEKYINWRFKLPGRNKETNKKEIILQNVLKREKERKKS